MANEKRLIDANALIAFAEFDASIIYPDEHTAKDILLMVKTAPIVDAVEVVHGRWLDGGETLFGTQKNYICSNCHTHTGIVKFNYCPNCGAKMDKTENP